MRTRSSKISPTQSRSRITTVALLTLSAALAAAPLSASSSLTLVPTRDQKVIRRWALPGDPRGVALGKNGIIYVGLAERQAVVAIDSKTGAVLFDLVLDSPEIAATKELVTLRTNGDRTRLFIAHGSDESATILSLPDLAVVREITMEGELIRDAMPDPKGRYLYLLGRRVHVFDAEGNHELRTLEVKDPMAIAVSSDGATLAVVSTEDYGNARATAVALYDTSNFAEIERDPLQTDKAIEAALFAAGNRALIAFSRDSLFEKSLIAKRQTTMTAGEGGTMRMKINFGDIVNSESVCLPEGSGPQIATLGAASDLLFFAERRCSASGALAGSHRRIRPASLYGVSAYAIAYDPETNTLAVTDRKGYLTIYKVPRAAVAK